MRVGGSSHPMRTPSTFLSLSLLSVGLLACSDPPPPSEVRSRISTDLGYIIDQTAAAADGTTADMPGLASFDVLSTALGGFVSSSDPIDDGTGFFAPMRRGLVDGEDFDSQEIIDQLNNTIFTDANHVGDGVYDIPSDFACKTVVIDDLGNETEELDPECVQKWDEVDLRVRVEEDDDTLRFAIQIGSHHDEPLEIALTHDSLAVTVDLDAAEAATETLAGAFGEQAPNARLSGRVTGKLTVLGAAHIDVDLTIDRALDLAFAEDGVDLDGADAFRMTSAASHVASVELDGNAGLGDFALDIGATTAHIPDETDSMDLDLGGLSAAANLTAGQPLSVTNISLGEHTTTIKRNGVQAIAIDLNPDDGRSFSATIDGDGLGNETLSVSPKLDVRLDVNHAALGESAPLYDVTRVLLDGELTSREDTNAVEVSAGTFSVTTNPAQYGFSATAGQCVSANESFDSTNGDYYTSWTVGACPL
ncbi:MAG: hypothetical protein AB7L94_24760 [Kofleriaceae bacterium]